MYTNRPRLRLGRFVAWRKCMLQYIDMNHTFRTVLLMVALVIVGIMIVFFLATDKAVAPTETNDAVLRTTADPSKESIDY